jgi:hypothetical protein
MTVSLDYVGNRAGMTMHSEPGLVHSPHVLQFDPVDEMLVYMDTEEGIIAQIQLQHINPKDNNK